MDPHIPHITHHYLRNRHHRRHHRSHTQVQTHSTNHSSNTTHHIRTLHQQPIRTLRHTCHTHSHSHTTHHHPHTPHHKRNQPHRRHRRTSSITHTHSTHSIPHILRKRRTMGIRSTHSRTRRNTHTIPLLQHIRKNPKQYQTIHGRHRKPHPRIHTRIPLRQVRNAQPQRHAIQKRKPTTLHHNTHRTSSRCHQSSIHPTSTTQTPVHSRQKPYSPQTHPSKIHTTPGTHHHPALRHILRTSQHHTLQSRTTTRHCHTPHRHRHTHLFPSHYKSAKKTHTTADKQRPITPETEPPKNKKSVPVSALIFIGRSARARPAREKTKNDASADATSWNATLNDYRLTPQC